MATKTLPPWLATQLKECAVIATQINPDAARDAGKFMQAIDGNSIILDTRLRTLMDNYLIGHMNEDEKRLFGAALLAVSDWRSGRTPTTMTRILTVRLELEDFDRYRLDADDAGQTLSDWARDALKLQHAKATAP